MTPSMRSRGWTGLAAIIAAVLLTTGAVHRPATSTLRAEPVVIELFTAQGCTGCPEANQAIEAVSEAPGVIALTYAVDYWDYLGWPDTFARPEFSARQHAYRQAMGLRAVSTPQVVIDGRRQLTGARPPDLREAIEEETARRNFPPQIEFRETGDRVGVGSGRPPEGGADVWAVIYRPGPQLVSVDAGDNRGQIVRHVNVVRDIRRLGDWNGRPVLYALPVERAEDENLVVLVQNRGDRRILNAAVL